MPFTHPATDGVSRPLFAMARPAPWLLAGLCLLALATLARADDAPFAAEGFRVVRQDQAGVAFEVDIAKPVFAIVGDPDDHIVEMGVPNFQLGGDTGAPGLPERVVWIGIPDGARISVDGAGLDPVDYGERKLAPRIATIDLVTPGAPRDPDRVSGTYPEKVAPCLEAKAYREARRDFPIAEVAGITGMRSQRVAAIRLRPAVYDPVSGRLSLYQHLTVTVRFSGGTSFSSRPPVEGAFEPIYKNTLLNYESARSFRRSFGERVRADARERALALGATRPAASPPLGFDLAPSWVKLGVDGKGIQRVSYEDLQSVGVSLNGIASSALRVFTRGGPPILDEDTYCDSCGLNEVAIGVVDGGDGHFDPGDYILFYGLPVSDWLDDFTGPGTTPKRWLDHSYETKNFYWLTWQSNQLTPPRRWATRDVTPSDPAAWPAPDYAARVHLEQDFVYRPNMHDFDPSIPWDQWAWIEYFDRSGAQNFFVDTPGAQTSQPARLFARMWGISSELAPGKTQPDHVLDVTFNAVPLAERTWNGRLRVDIDSTAVWIKETGNRLVMQAPLKTDPANPVRRDTQTFLFWELYFRRRFQAVNDVIEFSSPDTTGSVKYGLGAFTPVGAAGLRLLDVSDPTSPIELKGWDATRDTTGGKAVYLDDNLTGPRFYFGTSLSHFRRPSLERSDVRNVAAGGQGADYLVIAYDEFEPQAQRLADLRAHILPSIPGAQTKVVRISDVLACYSGGRMDPTAVRNFLYDVSKRWNPVPQYVCFFGDASYDFKNALHLAQPGKPAALIPSYVHGYISGQYMTDDWLADMDLGPVDPRPPDHPFWPNDIPDYITGRLPAATAGEADELVDGKIIPYDTKPTFGEWRNRALLVADDVYQGFDIEGNPVPDGLFGTHQYQSELLDAVLPPVIDRQKVYLSKFPFGSGTEKPAASAELKKWVNRGSLLWNFVGHGNPFKMADENAFIISDVPSLTNADMLTFVIAASCDVGKFDDPVIVGLGEALVKSASGGAIATLSSSDIAYSSANSSLNQELFRQLFTPSPDGYDLTLGQSVFNIKRRIDATENDRKYTLQGDPGTRLGTPHLDVRLQLFDDENGQALVDSLPRGRRVRVEADVHTSHDTTSSVVKTNFQGTATVLITDSAPIDTFEVVRGGPVSFYTYNPGGVFHGDLPVKDGHATARFYVPMEGLLGPRAKARVYVQNASDDGVGSLTLRMVDGLPSEIDTTGPTISLRFVDGKTVEAPDAPLRVVIEDAHGINLTGHTIPNEITLTVDDKTRYDLTDQFRYDPGSYTRGTLIFTLPGLTPGGHTISVSAADNFAAGILGRRNRSQASLDFDVNSGGGLPFAQVLNFPDPFHVGRGTQFVINGLSGAADVEVRIFNVNGSKVRSLWASGGPAQLQVGWDGKNEAGSTVAAGVYLYRVLIRPLSGGAVSDLEGRMAVIP